MSQDGLKRVRALAYQTAAWVKTAICLPIYLVAGLAVALAYPSFGFWGPALTLFIPALIVCWIISLGIDVWTEIKVSRVLRGG